MTYSPGFHVGLQAAADWHREQARLMRLIVEDGPSRVGAEAVKRAGWAASHHDACAALILNIRPTREAA
ncbi:MAG: hypothetical protein FD152_773 [Xanthobacteraceae bacterium]|nr:MAG: hypothetical protein FD152_773 [Xanthobacteraceae bacterium]